MSAIVSKVCGNCAGYCSNGDDPTCRETGQPVGYLWVRECWKEKAASELGKAVADEIEEQVSRGIKTPRGRRPQYPPVVDPDTGQVVSKRCRICGEYKPIKEFYKNHTHKDGHGDECRVCHNQKNMEAGRRRRAAKKAEKEDSRKAEEPAAAPVQETTAAKPSLSHFTDRELADELHARGWSGTLSKNLSVS